MTMSRKKVKEDEMLNNEVIERVLSPHPLSFMKLQLLCMFLIIWGIVVGWLVNFSEYKALFAGNEWFPILVWGLVLLLIGVVAALVLVQWSIFFLYLGVFIAGVVLMVSQGWVKDSTLFVPFYSVAVSIAGFLIVELYRRSHRYVITNMRIVFEGGVLTKQERTVRYDKITDIHAKQGVLGRLCGYGTIIPISQSGFGLGSDKSFAAGGLDIGGKKGRLLGLVGGGRDVTTPRARSYYELHGVYPYKSVKKLVENLVQNTVITPYQQDQVEFQRQQLDIQKQMRDMMKTKTKTTKTAHPKVAHMKQVEEEPEEEEEETEAELPPLEEDDIQKQMHSFLKKQKSLQTTKAPDELNDEEQDDEEKEQR
jgi:hypothetical protein